MAAVSATRSSTRTSVTRNSSGFWAVIATSAQQAETEMVTPAMGRLAGVDHFKAGWFDRVLAGKAVSSLRRDS